MSTSFYQNITEHVKKQNKTTAITTTKKTKVCSPSTKKIRRIVLEEIQTLHLQDNLN